MARRGVVITGIGTICGLGVGPAALWEGLVAGRSALRPIKRFDPTGFRSRLAAEADAFAGARDYVPKSYRKATKVMARDTELTVAAARLAVEDAKAATPGTLPEGSTQSATFAAARLGCHIGAGLIAAEIDELTAAMATARGAVDSRGLPTFDLRVWGGAEGGAGGMNNLPPLWMLKYLPNMLACHVTIIHGAEGPSNTLTGTQASGLLCIGESRRAIERGAADACFSGGGESPVNHLRLMRFDLAGRLAATGDEQDGANVVRPFDPASAGGLLGEGAGILILEGADSAAARGARPYAAVSGFGSAQSGIAPGGKGRTFTPDGRRFAIENALADANLAPADIDAIVPEAGGVADEDRAEADTLRAVFGPRLARVPLVTLGPAVGDCLAGQGGIAVAAAALAIRHQTLPARIHRGRPAAGLDAGPSASRPARLRHVLVETGSVGGQNAAVVVSSTA
ncbi:MAG: beta-ketoacyl synthase N-terminal-like domain-containing protein [Phycisphaerales bacterium]